MACNKKGTMSNQMDSNFNMYTTSMSANTDATQTCIGFPWALTLLGENAGVFLG